MKSFIISLALNVIAVFISIVGHRLKSSLPLVIGVTVFVH